MLPLKTKKRWLHSAAWLSLLIYFFSPAAWGGLDWSDLKGEWKVQSGTLKYKVYHFMHDAEGQSKTLRGWAQCKEPTSCSFEVLSPVATFVTRDPDRDRDMRKVTNESRFPKVIVKGKVRSIKENAIVCDIEVFLAGGDQSLKGVELQAIRSWGELKVHGSFEVSLTELKISPPTLLEIPIKDRVKISVDVSLTND